MKLGSEVGSQTVPSTTRVVFADHLRGVAAAIVVLGHLVGVYWASRDAVATATATPPLAGPASALFGLVAHEWFNFGAFGVAIFFLISGLVIPISLRRYDGGTFLLARMLRIYPTYLAGFALILAIILANSLAWAKPFPARWSDILSNALLVNDLGIVPDISLVSWTLCVEVKFYVLMATFASGVRAGSVSLLLAIGLGLLLVNTAGTAPSLVGATQAWPYAYRAAILDDPYLVFMLIGNLFHYHMRRAITTRTLVGAASTLLLIFVATWRTSPFAAQFPSITVNYFYAVAVFTLIYCVRDRVPGSKTLSFLADISYPLYVIHAIVGYSLLKYLMTILDLSFTLALAITLPVLIGGAAVLHITVENWSTMLAKRWLRRRAA